MAIEFGFCMICGKDIAPACKECGTRKAGSHYTEVVMEWSNGSKMPVAVCLDCAKDNKHTTAHAKQVITKVHQDHWDETRGIYDKGVVIV